ncbi:glycosyltransferase 61 family protein [Methylobacterium gnaphalii]|uniref:Glycosyltransferase 61 catalytic domain-containing protein n=1 Tax=Methylobacterium gnaphalii TaxID=1010610 RepID=A0A512JR55_9HYPH|nr:glycosyltransferase family 61 protein [Methylobacterium gnaphalii]GEP12445.1 hypothetical protein MGN01_42900 [Methylobacterium gnaphalii]GJD70513.1 hypothetical protein MMMDOFMJ_3462 [Methylobacterium gnaphalii]GLS48873.1 hypothetical protein GCM10007885_17200 [Methylobacterium gnaphalii]
MRSQAFRDVIVVPQRGDRYHGGPIWPNFYLRVRARTCWGIIPVPIDTRPHASAPPHRIIDAGVWCGIVGLHYGHMIASLGMRIVASAALDPALPLIFSLPDVDLFELPPYFWQMINVLGVDRQRLLFIREPVKVLRLYVFPQAERPFGGGPSAQHLDRMDRLFGDKRLVPKVIPVSYVSRSRVTRGGQIAGESYLEEVLRKLGVEIYFPEDHSVEAQVAYYAQVRRLIFSEGSPVHTLQLVGRLGADIAVLVRRPRQWHAFASLKPRARSLTYLRATEALVRGLGASRRSERHRGITIMNEAKLLREFARIGLDLSTHWDSPAYTARRDADIRGWIVDRRSQKSSFDEGKFIETQLAALGIDIFY